MHNNLTMLVATVNWVYIKGALKVHVRPHVQHAERSAHARWHVDVVDIKGKLALQSAVSLYVSSLP